MPPVEPRTQREMLETAGRKSEDTPGQNGPGIPIQGIVAVPKRAVGLGCKQERIQLDLFLLVPV